MSAAGADGAVTVAIAADVAVDVMVDDSAGKD